MSEDTQRIVAIITVTVATAYAVNGLVKFGKQIAKDRKIKKAANKED